VIIAAVGQFIGMFTAATFTSLFGYDFTFLFASGVNLLIGALYLFFCGSDNYTLREALAQNQAQRDEPSQTIGLTETSLHKRNSSKSNKDD